MKTITLQSPEHLDVDKREALEALTTRFYQQGKLSSGQCTELLNLSKQEFFELLSKFDIPVIDYDPSELESDVDNV